MKITNSWLKKNHACGEGCEWFRNQKETDVVKVLYALIKDEKLEWANWTICRVFNRKQKIKYALFAAEQVIDLFEEKYPDDKRPREAIEATKAVLIKDAKETRAAGDTARAAGDTARAAGDTARAAGAAARAAGAAAWAAGDAAWAARAAGAAARAAGAAALAAGDAAWAARAAGAAARDTAWAAGDAAWAAGATAWAAGDTAWDATWAAGAAAWAAGAAARAAWAAARAAALKEMQLRILNYGIELLEE